MTTTKYSPPTELTRRTFWTRLDNYEPIGREHLRGVLKTYPVGGDPDRIQYAIGAPNPFYEECVNGPSPVFLIDDGNTVEVCYVSGYQPNTGEVFLQPFPTNPDNRTRPDGRVIDYSTWSLGPRKSYHLKLHE